MTDKVKKHKERAEKRRAALRDLERRIWSLQDAIKTKQKTYGSTRQEMALLAVIEAFNSEQLYKDKAYQYYDKIDQQDELKKELKEARAENQALREKISEAANRSGLFIDFVRKKLGV